MSESYESCFTVNVLPFQLLSLAPSASGMDFQVNKWIKKGGAILLEMNENRLNFVPG